MFEEVDSEEREQAAAVDELEEEVEEEGEDEAVAWDKYHHFKDNSFDEGQVSSFASLLMFYFSELFQILRYYHILIYLSAYL